MRSNKAFIGLMALLFFINWVINIVVNHGNSKVVSFAEIIPVAILGTGIMYLTLSLNDFKTFSLIYGSIWAIWIIISLITYAFPVVNLTGKYIHTFRIIEYFSGMTQLYTPLPFLFYWVFIRSIKLIK